MITSVPRLMHILILSLSITGCQNSKDNEELLLKTFDLKTLPKVTTVKLSELGFKDIKYISLETTDSSLIQDTYSPLNFDRILASNDYIILKHFSTVLKFRNDGSFISKIGRQGRGPDEFQVCHDVEVSSDGQIYLADGFKSKLFIYSKNGNLLRTVNFPLSRKYVEYMYFDNKFLCYNQNNLADIDNSFNVIDTSGNIIKSFPNKYPFKRHPSAFGFTQENLFYRFNNQIFKKEVYCDTIFEFDKMSFKPHMVIQVGDKLVTPEIRSVTDGLDIVKKYIDPYKLFEFGDYVYYEFQTEFILSKGSKVYSFIGSKKDDFDTLIDTEQGLVNDLDGGPNITPITTKDDNTIVAMIDAIELKAYVVSDTFRNSNPKYPKKKEELEKLANSLKETDNPVIIMVSLKNEN
jgi:hypothetical protein